MIATPLLGLLLNLDPQASRAVALTLLAGTPALTFIGLIGAALSVTLRRGGLLLAVLVLPLTVPVLIFGVAASNAAIVGPLPFGTPFTILCALTLVSFVVGTFAAAAALRHGMSNGMPRNDARPLHRTTLNQCPDRPRQSDALPALQRAAAVARRRDRASRSPPASTSPPTRRTITSRARRSRSCSSTCRPPGSRWASGR